MRLIVLLISTLTFANGLYESMSLIERGELKKGYTKLENYFEQSKKDERIVAAHVLALAQDEFLENDSLYYSKYVEKFSKDKDSESYLKIVRKLGDNSYKENKLKEAHKYFSILISHAKTNDQLKEYAYFKKGWVFVNQKKYLQTFKLWNSYFETFPKGVLRNQFVQDFGKFWMEAFYQNQKAMDPKISKSEKAIFFKGIKNGYLRYAYNKPLKPFKKIKVRGELSAGIMSEVILTEIAFKNKPCDILDYFKNKNKSLFNVDKIFPAIDKCIKKKSIKAVQFAQGLDLSNNKLLYIAGQSLELKDNEFACKNFVKLSLDDSYNPKIIEGIARSCQDQDIDYSILLTKKLNIDKDLQLVLFSHRKSLLSLILSNQIPQTLVDDIAQIFINDKEVFIAIANKHKVDEELKTIFAIQNSVEIEIERDDLRSLIQSDSKFVFHKCPLNDQLKRYQLRKMLDVNKLDIYADNLDCFEDIARDELLNDLLIAYLISEKRLDHKTVNGQFMDSVRDAFDSGKSFSFRNAPIDFKKLAVAKDLGRLAFSVYMANKFKKRLKLKQLPKDFKNLKGLRWRLSKKKWHSQEILDRSFELYNETLKSFSKGITKLNIEKDKKKLLEQTIGGLKL